MTDGRSYLPVGTRVELTQGSVYEITGTPIGLGGGGVIYPTQRLVWENGLLHSDGFLYALKECFPISSNHFFVRSQNGEITARSNNPEDMHYLHRAQLLQLEEGSISRKIYQTASRMLPIRESAQNILLTLPGKETAAVANTVTIMDSISEKGRALSSWLKERGRFSPAETFRILQQLLLSLREVHEAGYLHLDIQCGNVFLRGTLEEKSELVTLIDFGSARTLTDGKTAPIRDRAIFTTPGFSAPEILLHNDGSLQLGPEADIYSVGCLALYLLTGILPDSHDLLTNRTGLFLKRNHLRRIQCPKHLVTRMQEILSKALDREPENRYHSVAEMLKDCTELADALQPYRTDLSSVTYDAFVCYKHGPVDSAAALAIQRGLEGYRAPKGICKKRKPFARVFVDEGELSSCSDFGQQIKETLKNSGWLIVVCSPDTPSSPWVQNEIETFLQFHDRSRILAVLTGGNEAVSFPPQLKGDADGKGEVLAADARGANAKEVQALLRKDALLKIAAPMLGTSFDSLKQRQRIYRMHRAVTAISVALAMTAGFAAYAVNRANVISRQSEEISQQAREIGLQAQRIEEEYRTSLINESRFLAEQAERRLSENDPMGALELALQALPSDTQDRPVIPEAEYVLGKVLGIYQTPRTNNGTASLIGIMKPELSFDFDFFLNESGDRLVSYNHRCLQVWDTGNMTILYQIDGDAHADISKPRWIPQRPEIVLQKGGTIQCINYETGKTQWEMSITDILDIQTVSDIVIVFQGVELDYKHCQEIHALFFSGKTGEQRKEIVYRLEEPINKFRISKFSVSSDEKWGVFQWENPNNKEYPTTMVILDLANGKVLEIPLFIDILDTGIFGKVCGSFLPHFFGDQLMVLRCSGIYGTIGGQYSIQEFSFPSMAVIELFDLPSGSRLWHTECVRGQTDSITKIEQTTFEERECALVTFDNECRLIDLRDGSVIKLYQTDAPILAVECWEDRIRTVNANGKISVINRKFDGNLPDDTIRSIAMLNAPITGAVISKNTVFTSNQRTASEDGFIRKFQIAKEPTNYTFLADTEALATSSYDIADIQIFESGAELTFWISGGGPGGYWNEEKQIVRGFTPPEEWDAAYLVGIADDGKTLFLRYSDEEFEEHLFAVSLLDGKTEEISIPLQYTFGCLYWHDGYLFTERDYDTWDIRLNYWRFSDPEPELWMDLTPIRDEILREATIGGSSYCGLGDFYLDERSGKGVVPYYLETEEGEQSGIMELDLKTGAYSTMDVSFAFSEDQDDWYPIFYTVFSRDPETGNCIISSETKKYVTNSDGQLLFALHNGEYEEEISSIYFFPDGGPVAVSYEGGTIELYRLQDGEKLSAIDLREYTRNSLPVTHWELTKEKRLLCYTVSEAYLLDVSEGELQMIAAIPYCFAYDPYRDRYLVFDGYGVGQLNCLSVEEMIAQGQELLGK